MQCSDGFRPPHWIDGGQKFDECNRVFPKSAMVLDDKGCDLALRILRSLVAGGDSSRGTVAARGTMLKRLSRQGTDYREIDVECSGTWRPDDEVDTSLGPIWRRCGQNDFSVDEAVLLFCPLAEHCACRVVASHQPTSYGAGTRVLPFGVEQVATLSAVLATMAAGACATGQVEMKTRAESNAELGI